VTISKFILLALVFSQAGCADRVPDELIATSTSSVETAPPVAGYFSIGDMERVAIEDRIVNGMQRSTSALILARVVQHDDWVSARVSFAGLNGSVTDYRVRRVRLLLLHVLDDPTGMLRTERSGMSELNFLVVDPTSVRRFDATGRMYLPIPGSQSPLGESDIHATHVGTDFVAVVSFLREGNFLIESGEVADDELIGERERVPLSVLAARASARRSRTE